MVWAHSLNSEIHSHGVFRPRNGDRNDGEDECAPENQTQVGEHPQPSLFLDMLLFFVIYFLLRYKLFILGNP